MCQDRRRRSFPWAAISLVLVPPLGGCGGSPTPTHETARDRPPAQARAADTDQKLARVAELFRRWVLEQKTAGQQPLFSRVEVLPVTQTVLPYGVGVNQQEPRLPMIVTTGPGWAKLTPDEKQKEAALVFKDLEDRLRRADLGTALRATLTLQTPRGMMLAWINDTADGPEFIHGDVD
jgi:hypothetical protein